MGQHLMSRPPKYVHGFIDRHGKPRFYFRKAGFKKMPLPGLPWSPAFMEAYEMAIGGAALDIGARRTHPGTINALVVTYFKSAKWEQLSPDTKRMHRRVIERFRAENGDKRVALLHEVHIRKRLDAIPGLSSKRQWLTAIRALLEAAVPTMRADNRPQASLASRFRQAPVTTTGAMRRSSNTASTGRSGRSSGWSWSLRWRRHRDVARLSG